MAYTFPIFTELRKPTAEELKCIPTQLFINGAFVPASSGTFITCRDPATDDAFLAVHEAREADVDAAVHAAAAAMLPGSPWRRMRADDRSRLLIRLADGIETHARFLASLEALDTGKPAAMALHVDIATAVRLLHYYAGWCDKLEGRAPASALRHGGVHSYSSWEPVGVVVAIVPFNFPLLGVISKLAPALATGCALVLKSAERTPASAAALASLICPLFPPGVVNILAGYGPVAGRALVSHPLVRKVTFTGSNAVGRVIAGIAAQSCKRVTLELGGKNACIVCSDADLPAAVRIACGGNYFNAGQICVGITRVFVPEPLYDEFIALAAARATARSVGDQWSGADQGPLIDGTALERVLGFIHGGVEEGARLVCGGVRVGTVGNFVAPTIFADVTDDMRIAREEIFGPVMCVSKYTTLAEAVSRANATPFGLAATVCTSDIRLGQAVARQLAVGTVWINTHGLFDPSSAYGGVKQSGIGREYGEEGLLHFMESKTVMIAQDGDTEAALEDDLAALERRALAAAAGAPAAAVATSST